MNFNFVFALLSFKAVLAIDGGNTNNTEKNQANSGNNNPSTDFIGIEQNAQILANSSTKTNDENLIESKITEIPQKATETNTDEPIIQTPLSEETPKDNIKASAATEEEKSVETTEDDKKTSAATEKEKSDDEKKKDSNPEGNDKNDSETNTDEPIIQTTESTEIPKDDIKEPAATEEEKSTETPKDNIKEPAATEEEKSAETPKDNIKEPAATEKEKSTETPKDDKKASAATEKEKSDDEIKKYSNPEGNDDKSSSKDENKKEESFWDKYFLYILGGIAGAGVLAVVFMISGNGKN